MQIMFVRALGAIAMLVTLTGTVHAQSAGDQGSFGIERGTGKIICTGDADMAPRNDDPSYALAALWDQMFLSHTTGICSAELTPLDGGTWGISAPFAGADSQGRQADFRLYVLHDRYAWKLGSSREIVDNGRRVDLQNVFATPQFFERFCSAKAVLSVGAASHEGPTLLNHQLARKRGETVSGQLRSRRGQCGEGRIPILYAINLGQHRGAAYQISDTSPQRRVFIVAAENLTLGINLQEALKQGIETQNVFKGISLNDYDLFEVESY